MPTTRAEIRFGRHQHQWRLHGRRTCERQLQAPVLRLRLQQRPQRVLQRQGEALEGADEVSVTAGSATPNINAQLASAGSITGTVTNASNTPLDDICVDAYDSSGDQVRSTGTNVSGDYTVGGLASGNYRLQFYDCGSNNVLSEYYNDKAALEGADEVSVTAGSATPNINAQLASAGSITGTVTNASNTPLDDICVDAYDSSGDQVRSTGTNVSGDYTVGGLASGNYRLQFYDCGSNNVLSEYYNDKAALEGADEVSVTAGSATPNINAQLASDQVAPPNDNLTDAEVLSGSLPMVVTGSNSGATREPGEPSHGGLGTGHSVWYSFTPSSSGSLQATTCSSGSLQSLAVYTGTLMNNLVSQGAGLEICSDSSGLEVTFQATAGTTYLVAVDLFSGNGSFQLNLSRTSGSDTHTLTAAKSGTGQGTITSSPAGINCGATCSNAFDDGTQVTLTATPTAGSTFTGWSGAGCSGTGSCQVNIASDQTATATFTVDTAPPDTAISAGPTGTISTNQATFTFAGNPAGDTAKIQCKIDSGAFGDCTSPKTFSALSDGPHTATFRAEDAAGNQDLSPATRTFTVDTAPPDTAISAGPTGTISTNQATFTFAGNPAGDTTKDQCKESTRELSGSTQPEDLLGPFGWPSHSHFQGRGRRRKPGPEPGHPDLHG